MRRRYFLTVLGGAAVWPLTANAQQPRPPTIGILTFGNPDPAAFLTVVREELAKLGYAEGRTCTYEIRSAGGNAAQLPVLASELANLPVDVLIVWQTPPTMAARNATKQIPIVMIGVGDPVATGIISSLARPGGNITGNTAIAAEVMSKNMELIREMLPSAARVAAFANTADPFTKPYLGHIEASAGALGISLEPVMALPTDNADAHFQAMKDGKFDAVIIQPTLLGAGMADLALKYQLPSFAMLPAYAHSGGLMAYGANAPAQWREGMLYVDKVLKGQRPADLPVAQPTQFDLVINLKTARALGITVPAALLARADEVIE
jgi:putative ABC transport system substrate-binding protein